MIPRFDFTYTFRDFIGEIKYNNNRQKPDLTSLEDYFGGLPLIFVEKARVGICMVLQALDLKPGANIGVQPFTCSSVLFAIKKAGFNIVFIDIDHNFRLSHDDLKIKNRSIDAIIVTHTFGFPENIEMLKSIMGDKPILEDCAQAFLSELESKPVGLSGDAGIFSTGYGKISGIGSGGFIVSKHSAMHAKLVKETERLNYPSTLSIYKDCLKSLILGVLYKPALYSTLTYPIKNGFRKSNSGLQKYPGTELMMPFARISLFMHRFRDNQRKISQQQENGRLLVSLIDKRFHAISPLVGSAPNFFLVPLLSKDRDRIIHSLGGKGIEVGKHFSKSLSWVRSFGYTEGDCPNFERIAGEVFTLPCHHYLSEEKIKFIAESLNNYHES